MMHCYDSNNLSQQSSIFSGLGDGDDCVPALQDGVMRGQQVAAMIRHVYPNVTPAELRHFEVMVDRQVYFKCSNIDHQEFQQGSSHVT